jgi:putative salt-induced outer membrane protein YdiY
MKPAALLLLVLPAVLAAQDAPPEKPFKIASDLSFVTTGGNTDVTTLGVADRIEWKATPRFTARQEFRWDYGETDGERSANALLLGVRGEVNLTSRVSVFTGVTYDYNLFAGVKRHFEELLGIGVLVLDRTSDKLRLDGGLSLHQEWEVLQNSATNFTAGRLAADYRHLFGEKAYIQQILEYIPNFESSADYRFNSESALVAPITGGVAIKVGYVVRYRGQPPEGFGTTDTTLRTGIQITN